ncbi:2-hydroxychromene-2-carboxylate isomerase [Rhodospirillum rubrum]|uniref:2-hydroxychromene-2-carboxylate isomerase n=1 Tax=Rhodospirillum rubrum (strain ATCC 11170 / ATH 1.1.1 / DSM 467 / LMG 4362 / NCIMB 8255 / S1) TaxID=269796 RepID=Q2RT01_RHORT|nr:2-hydroxychromene-2-carboxylate isomerase [Rhodospirillum rubrum]ABC22744.1 DSBA oxidoreductase [Rhodospirillum rubrum ATCC 11170]AEO48464.1 DSBA oxidoreductase [Rhodospirillum rubrum F11]MBK5954341.1 2-hydroxychromene-2-carboxylate isomerase [Rhodospirillum rubrum]QXG78736.1 2-hydroxychromene-2-carboxylate isomerase [Rhodospirillum rubrum]HAP99602.1 2-hydroxychromene-2-carboxylate isomerase [Rhodospirillum rubrum]
MPEPLTFYFDFSSPYSWIAAERIGDLAARYGRDVRWRAILLGPLFKESGNRPLINQPIKSDYFRRDFVRCLRLHGLEGDLPAKFPVPTAAAARGFLWLSEIGEAAAIDYALALFRAYFQDERDISDRLVVADIAAERGHDRGALLSVVEDPAWKGRLVEEVEEARRDGVFGAPFFLVDGEPFWGADRLDMVDTWLAKGGW